MSNTKLPALPETAYQLYYEWPDDEDGYGGSEVVDSDGYSADQMRAYAEAAILADRERQAGEAVTVESIRAAGGIVHGDGNIFFTNIAQLRASLPAPKAVQAEPMREHVERFAEGAGWVKGSPEGAFEFAKSKCYQQGWQDGRREALGDVHRDTPEVAAPSPDGKAEQAEAPSARAVLEAVNKALDEQGVKGGLARRHLEDRVLYHLRATQPTASPEQDSYDSIWNALHRIDSAAAMLPTYTVDHDGGIEAFTQNIVDAITRLAQPTASNAGEQA